MMRWRKLAVSMVVLAAAAASVVAQDGWRLSASDQRRAYALGQRHGDPRLNQFLDAYQQTLPVTSGGPQVRSIEVSTPYHQVVNRSRTALSYSLQRAQRDYRASPGQILVTVNVSLPPQFVYSASGPRIWDEFDVRMVQDGRLIQAHAVTPEPVYSSGPDSTLVGFLLRAEFGTHQVARGQVRVEVITHEQQVVGARFDLARLK